MSEDRTAETKDVRPLEERVFAKFEVVDERYDDVIIRLGKLEEREYDTKPIWERALAAIVETNNAVRETNERMNAGFATFRAEFKVIQARLDGIDQRFEAMEMRFIAIDQRFDGIDQRFEAMEKRFVGIDQRFDEMDKRFDEMDKRFDKMDKRFDKQDMDSEHNFRKVKRRLDILTETLVEIKADQRYVDNRLEKIEEKVFPE